MTLLRPSRGGVIRPEAHVSIVRLSEHLLDVEVSVLYG